MPSTVDYMPWLMPILKAALTLAGAYVFGRALNLIVAGRLSKLARESSSPWDDILVRELTKRIPLWSVLVGMWVSLEYWPLSERWLQLASRTISVLGFLSVTLTLASVATQLAAVYGPRAVPGAPVSAITQNVVRLVVVSLGLLVILNEAGIEIRPMLAALGVGGLAVALALQEPLANLFAGLFVSMAGQVRIGDQVKLDSGVEGRIVDFNWRSTWLEVPGGSVAVIPNAKLSQAVVTNFNLPTREVNVPVEFVVDYASDAGSVEQLVLAVARGVLRETDGAVPDFEPVVRFHDFGDVGLRATAVLRARSWADAGLVRHTFVSRLHARFREAGVVIPTVAPAKAAPPAP